MKKFDKGFALLGYVVVIAILLIASFMAYTTWSGAESHQTQYNIAETKAYFLAKEAIIKRCLIYLRTKKPTELPMGTIFLGTIIRPDYGFCDNITVRRISSMSEGDVFQRQDYYLLSADGNAPFHKSNREDGIVTRNVKCKVRMRSYSNYLYLTDIETTTFNEIIWFWGPGRDTLDGRVHSNDFIGMKGRPTFLGSVTTCQNRFIQGEGYNPDFRIPPRFNVTKVEFPEFAQNVRNNASHRFDDNDGTLMTRIHCNGEAITVYQYVIGEIFEPNNIVSTTTFRTPSWGAIFVEGQAEIYGIVAGGCTFGTAGNMWLIDNIKIAETNNDDGMGNENMVQLIGLISERNIIIANNWENGRENMAQGQDIIINASMVALDESFTFQHQNDDWEAYQGPTPDERGTIYMWGSVAQKRRGYVHRSNHIGTGYNKMYRYDKRLDQRPPPYFLDVVDEEGRGLFDIVQWQYNTEE